MRFGLHYLPTYLPELDGSVGDYFQHVFEQIQFGEELGYDDAWITEHHFDEFGGTCPDPAAFLSALAMRTERIHLGIAIVVLALHDPIRIAEAYAMVDNLCDGRLEFGVGRGSNPREFQHYGVSYDESAHRLKEAMEVVQQAWALERVDFSGKLYQYSGMRVLPKPVQRPHPPVWVAASRSDDTYRWAGEKGFNLMILPNAAEPAALKQAVATYQQALAASGHPTNTERLGKFLLYCADSDARAKKEAQRYMDNYWRVADTANPTGPGRTGDRNFDAQLARGTIIAGDPARCIEMIHFWIETLGMTTLSGSFHFGGMPQDLALKNIRLFSEKVMPALSSVGARA